MTEPNYAKLPAKLTDPMRRYHNLGIIPGDFLQAVLCNNLMQSMSRADAMNRASLWSIVRWMHNELPGEAWGSPELMKEWSRRGGHRGIYGGKT